MIGTTGLKTAASSKLIRQLRCVFVCLFLGLPGCTSQGNFAPVVESRPGSHRPTPQHIVSAGETLYSIAWRYGLDFRGLAAANKVAPPYTIYPGEKLVLREAASAAAAPDQTSSRKKVSRSSQPTKSTQKSSVKSPPKSTPQPPKNVSGGADHAMAPSWRWPAQGAVTRGFRANGRVHKGIDISGQLGESVYAANNGKVVYAGDGLVGYGNLLIIKHSESYLSAYAHNDKLLAREGDWIKVGARIAEMGDSGTDRVKLHFEIRRNGKPIDPISVLPGRK